MKLRTQLILAFLLLAVVPLGAITVYAYYSSARALRRTVEAESARLAGEMNLRMGVVTASLSRRIDTLESLPFPETHGGPSDVGDTPDPALVGRLVAALGEAAHLVDAFEFTPAPTAPPAEAYPGVPRAPRDKSPTGARSPRRYPAMAHPGAPAVPSPVVIPLPKVVQDISNDPNLASVMKMASALIPPEEADRLRKELQGNLGEGTEQILHTVKEKILAEAQKKAGLAKDDKAPASLALKQEFGCPLKRNGQTVGHLKAKVSADRLLREVLSQTRREQGEIPFAIDASGALFTPDSADEPKLRGLERAAASGRADSLKKETADAAGAGKEPRDGSLDDAMPAGLSRASVADGDADVGNTHGGDHKVRVDVKPDENWVVVTREDPTTGLVFGIARPVGEALGEIRRASARNLGAGLMLAALALFGIVPISRRMTHNLSDLTRAAGELAAGNLDTQVPVRSRDELGHLAQAFNRMARELASNQERLVEQERLRKELELCRRIQSELLPRRPLSCSFAEAQGVSIPAHELGGDFFNYFVLPGEEVALFMGDVSGKGVPAALLMANLQATLRARIPLERDLAAFAERLDREVEGSTPPEVYLTLFLGILDPKRGELRYVNAGHESPFLLRGDGRLERLEATGRPVGLLSGGGFTERWVPVEPGDRLILYTDGLVEAENAAGAAFGCDRLERVVAEQGAIEPASLLARVERAYQDHRGAVEAADDATLLVLKVGEAVGTGTAPRVARRTILIPPERSESGPAATA
ncbi:MAG TPA: SpoIIE family protein phosphatase [Candidatus Polarisedimenticolia bacterium]|nr:SpoIIE family protein phosphatase [Candidatus Polarisedimenticolia bacterium]